ncbi:MAG: RNA polymerase sigma factor [Planctomycetes bacterium]|nr:RNA polymerase sigma factor [Planctomycetota bacterium]
MSKDIMDEHQFSEECESRRRSLMAYAYTCCNNVHLAEDIVQDTLLIAFNKRESYFAESDFGAWLIAIARNVWFKERDKRRIRDKHMPFIQEHAAQIFNNANYNDNKWENEEAALNSCLQKLSDVDQELISRHFQQEEKYQDIAGKLGKTLSWVKVRMHRSRKALLECVQRGVETIEKGEQHAS